MPKNIKGSSSTKAGSTTKPSPPAKVRYAFVNGKIVPEEKAMVSVFDRGLVLGDGLFETVRAMRGHPQFFRLHYLRLAKSAKRLRIRLEKTEAELCQLVQILCRKSGLDDAVVRITLTRGRYQGGLAIDKSIPPSLIITVSAVSGLPQKIYADGVKVAISSINKAAASGLDSAIKSTNYLANIFAKAQADSKGCYEAILLGPNGEIAELSTSSFFCVAEGLVLTPPIDTGILPGITRQVLLRILKREGIAHREVALFPAEIGRMTEAFLCSSVRGPLAIRSIDGIKIGSGRVGPIYQKIRELYDRECLQDLEKDLAQN